MLIDDVLLQQRLQQKNELLDSCAVAEKNYEYLRNFVLQINSIWIIPQDDSGFYCFSLSFYICM